VEPECIGKGRIRLVHFRVTLADQAGFMGCKSPKVSKLLARKPVLDFAKAFFMPCSGSSTGNSFGRRWLHRRRFLKPLRLALSPCDQDRNSLQNKALRFREPEQGIFFVCCYWPFGGFCEGPQDAGNGFPAILWPGLARVEFQREPMSRRGST